MKQIFLVFPHQLFQDISKLHHKKVLLIEEPLFFSQYDFHIQKLILHRASMKFYEQYLSQNAIEVEYFEDESYMELYKDFEVHFYDVTDDWLLKKILKNFSSRKIYYNPNFLNVNDDNKFLHKYYINRRKENNIFIHEDGKPFGGKWSFDSQNRKKYPKDQPLYQSKTYNNPYIQEAKEYCKKFNTVGECKEFYYPTTFEEAKENFKIFLEEKFHFFGDYQDAIVKESVFLYHSNISSSLNIGLLDLHYVISSICSHDAPFNAKEGFIRQIIGWREFMFSIYKSSHISLRNSNFFHFRNSIPPKLLSGQSGIQPFDDAIKNLNETAYNHHIQRLMIIGNLFVLLEIDPNEVYGFFMARYIDAYDWVMVGNVYAMSGYCDGGSITTKPYISSSNYILKMSNDYSKNDPWCKIWDGLYWRFLHKHKELFAQNIRMKMQIALLDKMDKEKLNTHLQNAQNYLNHIN